MRTLKVPHPLAFALSAICTVAAPFAVGYAVTRHLIDRRPRR